MEWVQEGYIDTAVWMQLRTCVEHDLLRPFLDGEEDIGSTQTTHNYNYTADKISTRE